jgi:tripartite-type tricarboxylate transporter receptor subunit TctC
MKTTFSTARLVSTIIIAAAACGHVAAQNRPAESAGYPARPIRLIVAQAPGSSTDIVARVIGQKLTVPFGQQIIVDNRAGANGLIGFEIAAKARPDGYTLIMAVPSALTINQHIYKNLPYDPARDFAPVTQATSLYFVLFVNPAVPAQTLSEFVALAKSRPAGLNYSSPGIGNLMHLAAVMFTMQTGTKMTHVPDKGETPAVLDVMTGQVEMMIATMPAVAPHIKAGKLRALAVLSQNRAPALPDIPSAPQAGYPDLLVTGWTGVLAPAGTPAVIIDKLQQGIARLLLAQDVKDSLASQGADSVGSSPKEFAAFIKSEAAKWGGVVKSAGLSSQL